LCCNHIEVLDTPCYLSQLQKKMWRRVICDASTAREDSEMLVEHRPTANTPQENVWRLKF